MNRRQVLACLACIPFFSFLKPKYKFVLHEYFSKEDVILKSQYGSSNTNCVIFKHNNKDVAVPLCYDRYPSYQEQAYWVDRAVAIDGMKLINNEIHIHKYGDLYGVSCHYF